MKICELRPKNKKGFLYLVTIDETTFELTEDVLVAFRLKKNVEIDEPTLRKILSENEKSLCVNALLCSLTLKTEKEFRERLYHKGFSRAAVEHALAYGKRNGLVDDARYAERYYERFAAKKSVALIRKELRAKGVSPDDLTFLADREDDETILLLAQKFLQKKERTPLVKEKLMRHLVSKGFSYGDVIRTANRLFDED